MRDRPGVQRHLWLESTMLQHGRDIFLSVRVQISNYSEFLGFKLKLRPKSGKWVLKSHMTNKAQRKCKENIRKAIALMGKEPSQQNISRFNAVVLGLHEYYKIATNVYLDFVWRCQNRLKNGTRGCADSPTIEEADLHRALVAAINGMLHQQEYLLAPFEKLGIIERNQALVSQKQ